jgi:uncharacterized protein YecE (DUF72 family)
MTCSVAVDTAPSLVRRAAVGTSGWSYPSWRPGFYPAGSRPEDFLHLYASRLRAVELNATGYRLPSEDQFRRWAEQVPDGFRFAVKAPPRVTRRLEVFQERVRALGDRLGAVRVVVETPRDDGFLELLLGSIDPSVRWALDLRDPTWDEAENEIASRLAEANAVCVDDLNAPGEWRYVRFREPPWSDEELASQAQRLRPLLVDGVEVLAFFRHEDEPAAPRAALRLLELLGG